MTIRCIDAGTVPYVRSQSIYHGLGYAQKEDTPDTIVLARPASQYICIGNFQDISREVDLTYCTKNNLPVIRRQTGGGAVLIDENQVFIQWVFHTKSLPAQVGERFEFFLRPLIETHKFFGIDAYYHPVNDVHVGGKKIVGTGAATIGNAEVLTGNFLFDFNRKKMAGALHLPGNLFRSRVEESLSAYLTTINEELPVQNPDAWKKMYLSKCKEILQCEIEERALTDFEIREIERMDSKLVEESWLFGVEKKPNAVKLVKIHAGFWLGQLEFSLQKGKGVFLMGMKEDSIEEVKIKLEFERKTTACDELEKILPGLKMDQSILMKYVGKLSEKYSDDDLLMKPEEWVGFVLKIRNEKIRVSGS